MNTPSKLFVYGSLRSGFRNPAYEYLTRFFKYEGEALVKGRFYDKGSHPVAVPSTEEQYISGELYSLNSEEEFSWVFTQLDDYEGVITEPGETALYRRAATEVLQNGETLAAWIYWYNHSVESLAVIENGDVMNYLIKKNRP